MPENHQKVIISAQNVTQGQERNVQQSMLENSGER